MSSIEPTKKTATITGDDVSVSSTAPTLTNDQQQQQQQQEQASSSKSGSGGNFLKRLLHPGKHDKEEGGVGGDQAHEKKKSISESGPYVFAFDPNTGKEVLQKNPHWPAEDSWKREEMNKGLWAMGGEAVGGSVEYGAESMQGRGGREQAGGGEK